MLFGVIAIPFGFLGKGKAASPQLQPFRVEEDGERKVVFDSEGRIVRSEVGNNSVEHEYDSQGRLVKSVSSSETGGVSVCKYKFN